MFCVWVDGWVGKSKEGEENLFSKKDKIAMVGDEVDIILKAINEYMERIAEKQIRIAFDQAEKEVKDLQQRTKEGLRQAKKNGVKLGRPEGFKANYKYEKDFKEIILKNSRAFNGNHTDQEVMALINLFRKDKDGKTISKPTYCKYKRELKEERA